VGSAALNLSYALRGMARFQEAPQIPDAARFVHWEKPVEFNATVRAFVRTLPSDG